MKLEVADIKFGDIDARHEILSRDPSKRRLFIDSFFVPENFQINDLMLGEKWLIVGPKGSGKTAYLRYLQHSLGEKKESFSRFIIFRDEITTQDRDRLLTLADFRFYENAQLTSDDETVSDCSAAWQLFIHREIATLISKNPDTCARTVDVNNYISLLERFFSNYKTSAFKQFLKKIAKGRMKIASFGNSLELEAEFIDAHGNIDISEFVRYCNSVASGLDFNSLRPDVRFNIFFDELNISFVSGTEFRKNAALIRDLVSACGIMNSLFGEHRIPIYIYSAIRSEVIDSVESSVRELRKWVDDKGVLLDWLVRGVSYDDQPIMELLQRRIQANQINADPKFNKEVKLSDYFETQIFNRPFSDYIIFESWARPRDIVRLLSTAAKYVSKGQKFSTSSFLKSKTEYSTSSWEEKRDELNSKYAQAEIDSIKTILTNFQTNFSLSQFTVRVTQLANNNPRINQFVQGRMLNILLEDLYKVGVLGNMVTSRKGSSFPTFLYNGNSNFSSESVMCIHRSLWRELKLEATNEKISRGLSNFGEKKRP